MKRRIKTPREVVGEEPETLPEHNLTGWRKLLRDENGQPLPEQGIRIDVTTGQRVDDPH